jgi:hypothetical protein
LRLVRLLFVDDESDIRVGAALISTDKGFADNIEFLLCYRRELVFIMGKSNLELVVECDK